MGAHECSIMILSVEVYDLVIYNKARNSHKPRLGEYVQQGNIRSITYIVNGVPFSSLIKKFHQQIFWKKNLVLKF